MFDCFVRNQKILLIFKNIVFVSGSGYINQMIRDFMSIDRIIGQIFSGAEIHSPVYLTGVGTDNFCIQFIGQSSGKRSFA